MIWDFSGEEIPADLYADLTRLCQELSPDSEFARNLRSYLNQDEIAALAARAQNLLASGRFPDPHPNRRPYPWPPV